jgi:type I restriction enzyme, R subunit
VLKAAIRAQLEKMILLNRTRADFVEKFEALIESYNADSAMVEALYNELLALSHSNFCLPSNRYASRQYFEPFG